MPKRYGISVAEDENVKQKGLKLNSKGKMQQLSESSPGMKRKKTVKPKTLGPELLITRRVLRSGFVTRGIAKTDEHHVPVEEKTKEDDNATKISGTSSVVEVKEEVTQEQETQGDDFTGQIKVECKDHLSYDGNGSFESQERGAKGKRKRGRPAKLHISSQSDESAPVSNCNLGRYLRSKDKLVRHDDEEKLVARRYFSNEKTQVKLEDGQSAEATNILGGNSSCDFETEIKDDRSYGENGNVEPHDEELKVKRKRGRPRKFQGSSQSDENGSNKNCKLARTKILISQPSVDRLRPPRTNEPGVGLPRRPKSNYGCMDKGPESDGGHCRGRKMLRRQCRPPTPQKERKSGGTDESGCRAKKRLKLCEGPLESQHDNSVTDRGRRDGEQKNKQNEAGSQSKLESKKMLSDRILQLLLAAGWTVEYRPRNGRAYKDAVYLNPEGKTHWSVTKAYKVYKQHVEIIMKDQMNSTSGSDFGLLPEEDLHLLGRKVQKKRCDTGKEKRKWKDGDNNKNAVSSKRVGKRTRQGKKVQKGKTRLQKLIRARHGKKKQGESHGSQNLVSVRKIKKEVKHNRKRCALSARNSLEDADSRENGYILFDGKRTMLGWMIDSAIMPLNEKVQCMNCQNTEVLLEGIITREGVRCKCCEKLFSVLDFEIHAGGKHNQPFKNLYLEGGNALLQSLLGFWNKQSESLRKGFHIVDFGGGDPNDDTCCICGDGGDLICCDGCPSTFHQSCLDIKTFPSGAWFCCYCSCKYCKKVEAANHDTATLPPLSSCSLCEEKYHQACIKQDGTVPGERSTHSFCGKDCQELFEGLHLLIGVKHPLPEGFSWTFLRRFELPREVSDCENYDKIAYNAKVAVAFSVMDECFSPLVDHRSGVNLLQNIVYNFGSNFHRLNYSSFLTAVLERGEEVIAVASIRIHGNQLAEMPFIGTRYMYRRQGMCRRLMSGIESALRSLKVDKLVIPAVPELMDTWTSGFGFGPVLESEKKTIKNLNLVVFPGVDMLEKSLVTKKIAESNESSCNGHLPLVPEMSLPEDVEDNKLEKSQRNTHDKKCSTADVESPFYLVDSGKSMSVEKEGDNDAGSNLKLLEGNEEIRKLTEKDIDSLPDVVDDCNGHSQVESNSRVVDDAHANKINTKKQESRDLVDNTPFPPDDGCGAKAEIIKESDKQPNCYVIDHSQPLASGCAREGIDSKSLAVSREKTTTIRVSPRLIQRSWRTSPVKYGVA